LRLGETEGHLDGVSVHQTLALALYHWPFAVYVNGLQAAWIFPGSRSVADCAAEKNLWESGENPGNLW
jgi:hypothetical protein